MYKRQGYYYDDASNKVTCGSGDLVPQGVLVNLLATPDEGYAVDEWYQDGEPAGDFLDVYKRQGHRSTP